MTDPQTTSPDQVSLGELTLEPPRAVGVVTPEQAATTVRVDEKTAQHITQAVNTFIDSLTNLDPHSPDFQRKVQSVSQMGNQEVRRSAEVSNRFLDRPAASLDRGPLGDGSKVSTSLVQLRRQVEDLDPSKRGLIGGHRLLDMLPFRNRVRDYFHRYQSSQH